MNLYEVVANKNKNDKFVWKPENIVVEKPPIDRGDRFVWKPEDLIIEPPTTQVLSWKSSFFKSKDVEPVNHLSDEHKAAIDWPRHQALLKQADEHGKSLNKQHHNAVMDYQDSSGAINHYHRTGKVRKYASKEALDNQTKHLDHVTSMPLHHDTVLYRGVHPSMANVKPGTKFTDKGYPSTSLDKDVAQHASSQTYEGAGKHVARIFVPKGSKAAYVPKSHGKYHNNADHEQEVLLPRNSHFKVLGHHVENGVHHIDMELHHPKQGD